MEIGRYDHIRWKKGWQDLFDTHTLVHNNRAIIKISISKEGDGAFAVVDVDTLWCNKSTGKDFLWKGRACKVYTKMSDEWKLITHTGLLEFK
jgi:ketosteroid isomerase-like protein